MAMAAPNAPLVHRKKLTAFAATKTVKNPVACIGLPPMNRPSRAHVWERCSTSLSAN